MFFFLPNFPCPSSMAQHKETWSYYLVRAASVESFSHNQQLDTALAKVTFLSTIQQVQPAKIQRTNL